MPAAKSSKSNKAKPVSQTGKRMGKTPAATTRRSIPETVGQTLKQRRLSRGLSLADVEKSTRIRGKYLVAMEADDYPALPPGAYAKGFIHSYSGFLGLDPAETLAAYAKEYSLRTVEPRRQGVAAVRFILTPRLLTLIGGMLAVVVIGAYLITQFRALTAPPQLSLTNPSHDQVLYGSLITISGYADETADVFVNGSPILSGGNGHFTDAIALENGVNTIKVSAKNSLGKTTTITRHILAHLPQTSPGAGLPSAPFSGVAVKVQVQNRPAAVTVQIDGKKRFSGTMLPGASQTFTGAQSVTIATSDGGATDLTVTNSVVAGKSLGAIGPDRQAVSDFQFETDTHFQ